MKNKKIPLRKCLGCNQQFAKKELVRVVKTKDGQIFLDHTNRANGRGAYICRSAECLKLALKRKAIQRSLAVALSDEVQAELERAIINVDGKN